MFPWEKRTISRPNLDYEGGFLAFIFFQNALKTVIKISYDLFTQIWNKEVSSVPVPPKKSKEQCVVHYSKAGFWEAKILFSKGVWPFQANYNRITHYKKTLKQSNRNQYTLSFVKSELVYVWNRTQVIWKGSEGRRLWHVKRAEDGHGKEYTV